VCVMAETSLIEDSDEARLRIEIMKAGMAIDVSIAKIYLVPPRFLIKSSSGKPSRQANRDRTEALH
jgi:fatty-acyl-CoA synthase